MSAEHADREAGSIPNIPSTYQWPTAVRVLDLQPGFRIGGFLRGAIDRQTMLNTLDDRRSGSPFPLARRPIGRHHHGARAAGFSHVWSTRRIRAQSDPGAHAPRTFPTFKSGAVARESRPVQRLEMLPIADLRSPRRGEDRRGAGANPGMVRR